MADTTDATAYALGEMRKGTSYDEIRRNLVEMNFSPDEVISIMKMADHMSMSYDYGTSIRKNSKEYFWFGFALLVAGIGMSIYALLSSVENTTIYFVALGPVFGGGSLMYRNYKV